VGSSSLDFIYSDRVNLLRRGLGSLESSQQSSAKLPTQEPTDHFFLPGMGSAVTLPTLPDTIDEATCKTLAGDKFDQAVFDSSKDEAGNITKEKFTELWNATKPPPPSQEDMSGTRATGETKAADTTPVEVDVQKKFHSMCRWDKPSEEIAAFVAENPGSENSTDTANGNKPLHIAAQNGHVNLVRQLLGIGVLVDAPNGTGTTALHVRPCVFYMSFVVFFAPTKTCLIFIFVFLFFVCGFVVKHITHVFFFF
jgi:hypothetical protein